MSYQPPLTVIIKGAIAGAAGTAVMTAVMERAPQLVARVPGLSASPPPPPRAEPDAPASPTEALADRVATGVARTSLAPRDRATAGQAIHWGYGAGWGALYGVLQSSLKLPHLLHGTLLGGIVGGAALTVVPRLGLVPPPEQQSREQLIMSVGSHLVYGWSTAIVYAILNLGRRG